MVRITPLESAILHAQVGIVCRARDENRVGRTPTTVHFLMSEPFTRGRISSATIGWARRRFRSRLFLDTPGGSPLRFHFRSGVRTEGLKPGCRLHAVSHRLPIWQ